MNRRDLIRAGLVAGGALVYGTKAGRAAPAAEDRIKVPADGKIPVAFLISDGAVVIDFAGPWEVFQDVMLTDSSLPMDRRMPFNTYTVSASAKPIRTAGGMMITPKYTFANAPQPKVIVIPAQDNDGPEVMEWIRKASQKTDVTMSVCTGAFLLAKTGLLDGKSATTHHAAYKIFEKQFPKVTLKRGARFVEEGNLASAGGLTSGMDLAQRVVERYFGTQVAEANADNLEYQGVGWKDPGSNAKYTKSAVPPGYEEDPVCGMAVPKDEQLKAEYKGTTYYFCMESCRRRFLKSPQEFVGTVPKPKSM